MADATKTDAATGGGLAGAHAREQTRDLTGFDYAEPAELVFGRWAGKRRPEHRRFDTAAQAVRFVVEELPAAVLPGTYLLVDDARFGVEEMRYLYESVGYPLSRDSETC